jgi:metal-sulfur cluster biosynthetic enzyme
MTEVKDPRSSSEAVAQKTSAQVNAELEAAMIPPMTELSDDGRVTQIVENLRHVYDPEIPVNISISK